MSTVDQRIAALSPEQRELLLRRLRERGVTSADAPAPPELPSIPEGVDRLAPVALTDVQEAFWLGRSGLFDLGGCGANVYIEHEFPGLVWPFAEDLDTALNKLIARQEILRTVVLPSGRQQVLAEPPAFAVEIEDLSHKSDEEIEEHLRAVREEMRYAKAPVDRLPLFQIVLHQVKDGMIRLHARFDAMLIDGSGRGALSSELVLFLVFTQGTFPPPAFTFLDYARALEEFRTTATWQRARAYWLERVPSLPAAPRLPLVRDLTPEEVPRIHKRETSLLGADAWGELCRRAAGVGLTPTGVITAAFAETLRAWSANPAFTLGFGGSYRPPIHPEIGSVIGTFTTLHLLSVEDDGATFVERARRLQSRITSDVDHQEFSGLRALREYNRLTQSGTRATLPIHFNSVVEYGFQAQRAAAGLATTGPAAEASAAPAEEVLEELAAVEAQGPAAVEEESAPPPQPQRQQRPQIALNLTDIDLLISLPQVVFLGITLQNPDGGLDLITQAFEEVLPDGLVPALLAAYGGLLTRLVDDETAWREERPLRAVLAAPAEPPVRPLGDLAAMPAAAAAAFAARAESAPAAPALITPQGTVSYGELARRARELGDASGATPGADPASSLAAAAVACGLPAAPALSPGGLAAALDLAERCGIGPADRLLAAAPAGSELALFELFGALCHGAALVVPAPEAARDAGRLATTAARERVTVWISPAGLLEAVVTAGERDRKAAPRALRLVLAAGEAMPVSLPGRLAALAPAARLWGVWGIPEAPFAAAGPLRTEVGGVLALTATPAPGVRLQVVDSHLDPRPEGVPGELCVSGPAVGGRLLRTGERAALSAGGALTLLGGGGEPLPARLGYGVELGRIETALGSHPAVRAAAVAWRTEGEPAGRLIAWLVPRGKGPDDGELRKFLRDRLPEHLVPVAFVRVAAMPLTPDGRCDRAALATPPSPAAPPAEWDEVETTLADLWETVLGQRPQALTDDFFAAGGNSLTALRLLQQVAERWGTGVPPGELFAHPTLEGLAVCVRRSSRGLLGRLGTWARTRLPQFRPRSAAGSSKPQETGD
jgi:non-ribosomal peptide synthetase component F